MSTIKANTLTGTTSAGSILVTGEGGVKTTNLQQGLGKAWCTWDGTNNTLNDNLNITSLTDSAVGVKHFTPTNNMANDDYAMAGMIKFYHIAYDDTNSTTSSFKLRSYYIDSTGGGRAEYDHNSGSENAFVVFGDLA